MIRTPQGTTILEPIEEGCQMAECLSATAGFVEEARFFLPCRNRPEVVMMKRVGGTTKGTKREGIGMVFREKWTITGPVGTQRVAGITTNNTRRPLLGPGFPGPRDPQRGRICRHRVPEFRRRVAPHGDFQRYLHHRRRRQVDRLRIGLVAGDKGGCRGCDFGRWNAATAFHLPCRVSARYGNHRKTPNATGPEDSCEPPMRRIFQPGSTRRPLCSCLIAVARSGCAVGISNRVEISRRPGPRHVSPFDARRCRHTGACESASLGDDRYSGCEVEDERLLRSGRCAPRE